MTQVDEGARTILVSRISVLCPPQPHFPPHHPLGRHLQDGNKFLMTVRVGGLEVQCHSSRCEMMGLRCHVPGHSILTASPPSPGECSALHGPQPAHRDRSLIHSQASTSARTRLEAQFSPFYHDLLYRKSST